VREAQLSKIPLVITLGEREKESGTLSVRTLEGKVRQGVAMEAFLERVCAHIRERSRDPEIF
jgi:threonyl-tRNA synthetase